MGSDVDCYIDRAVLKRFVKAVEEVRLMILYFTATGNSLAVAQIVAEAVGERLFDIGVAYRAGQFEVEVEQGETIGFVFPVYRWSTPPIIDDFVKRASFVTSDGAAFKPGYCFAVETYGYFTGTECKRLARELAAHQGISLDAAFAVKSVGNCLYLFDTPSDDVVAHKLALADEASRRIAALVAEKHRGDTVSANPLGTLIGLVTNRWDRRATWVYSVQKDKCVGCGTCASVCPTNTIRMVDGYPVWEGHKCTECLACIHRCPKGASQHGPTTVGRRRYLNPVLK